jgi:histidinol-phosphate aminotransferase
VKLRVPIPANVRKLHNYYAPMEGRRGKLRLDFNENTVGCSPAVLRALRKLTAEDLAMYSEYQAPTQRLARWFGVQPNEFMLTNGADGGLQQIIATFVDQKSTVLLVEPTFVMYRFYLEMTAPRIKTLKYDNEMGFPMKAVMKELRKSPRAFFLANPNNPTGTLLYPPELERMIRSAPLTLFIIDEAYFDFSGATVVPWIRKYPNLIVARTFSKAAGLAGLRLGYLFACPEVMKLLSSTREPFPVNTAALVAAEATVKDHKNVEAYAAEVGRGREMLASALAEIGVRVFPSAGNFLLADFGRQGPRILKQMSRRGILLRDRTSDFGRPGYIRITAGTRPQMKRLIRALKKVWK